MVTKDAAIKLRLPKVRESAAAVESSSAPTGLSREIGAGEFKARCLALMDEVQRSGAEYVVTKRGVPVARLVPARFERRPLLGSMRGTVTTKGDLVAPLDEPWTALDDDGDGEI